MADIWDEARIAELTRLWAAGQTAGEIGKALGISSAAVLGKARRLALPLRRPGIPRSVTAPDPPNLPGAALRAEPPRPSSARSFVTLFRLRADSCRYPLGKPWDKAVFFCGAPAAFPTSPYCETHRRICYSGRPDRADRKGGWK